MIIAGGLPFRGRRRGRYRGRPLTLGDGIQFRPPGLKPQTLEDSVGIPSPEVIDCDPGDRLEVCPLGVGCDPGDRLEVCPLGG